MKRKLLDELYKEFFDAKKFLQELEAVENFCLCQECDKSVDAETNFIARENAKSRIKFADRLITLTLDNP